MLCATETAFDEYLQRDCSRIKSSNLARCVILSPALWEFCSLIAESGESSAFIGEASFRSAHSNVSRLSNQAPITLPARGSSLILPFSPALPPSPLQTCLCAWVDGNHGSRPPSPLGIIQLITAPSFFATNSAGGSCQAAYADRRGGFARLLLTQDTTTPRLSGASLFLPPHSLSCHAVLQSSPFFGGPLLRPVQVMKGGEAERRRTSPALPAPTSTADRPPDSTRPNVI